MAEVIRPALARIYTIQAGLSITDPVAASVAKVYHYVPPQSQGLTTLPAFVNEWSFGTIDTRRMMAQRELNYVVTMSFAAARAGVEDDRSADSATAFWEAALAAFSQDVTLAGTVTLALLRGGQPTLGIIQRGGEAYIGWTAFLDIRYEEAYTWR